MNSQMPKYWIKSSNTNRFVIAVSKSRITVGNIRGRKKDGNMFLAILLKYDRYTLFCHTLQPRRDSRYRYTLARYFVPNISAKDISEVSWRSAISAGRRYEMYYILLRKYWSVKYHLLIWGSTICIPPLNLSFTDYESFPLTFILPILLQRR